MDWYEIHTFITCIYGNQMVCFSCTPASITSICQPIGSVVSPYLTDSFGRQKTMLLLNIPFGVSWILLYFSSNLTTIYIAMTLLGMTLGQ